MIEPGELVFCNVTLTTKKKKVVIVNEVILGREYEKEMQMNYTMEKDGGFIIGRFKLEEDVEITKIDIIKSMGYKVVQKDTSQSFSQSEKNERQANGTY